MEVSSESVAIRNLVEVVKASIRAVQGDEPPRPGELAVSSAELNLQVMMDTTVGGRVDLRVPVIGALLRIGGRRVRHRMHTVQVLLMPAEFDGGSTPELGVEDKELVLALRAVRELMEPSGQGGQAWSVAGGKVQVQFGVTDEGSISVGLNADHSDEHVHSLHLELQPAS